MYQNPKSATTAGLFGIFLGGVGVHNFYLGDKKKGAIHICLVGSGIVVFILSKIIGAICYNNMRYLDYLEIVFIFTIIDIVAGLATSASSIWGLVEGIIILCQGDAGLARKGIYVAQPAQPTPQPMAQPYAQPTPQPMTQPYTQPSSQPMAQPYTQPTPQPMTQPYTQPSSQPMAQPYAPQSAPQTMPIQNDNNMETMNNG